MTCFYHYIDLQFVRIPAYAAPFEPLWKKFFFAELGWLELIICMELFQAFLLNWILFPQLENHQQHAQHPLTTKPS